MIPRRSPSRRDRRLQKLLLIPSAILAFFVFRYFWKPSSTQTILDTPEAHQPRLKTEKSFLPTRYLNKKKLTKPVKVELGTHQYGEDGLVTVNPTGPHPIFELVARAQAAWDRKLERSSKTLDQAVAEYKRRYRRPPPRGFDEWWQYVQDNNVQLPDEYDTIHRDLEHFWGIEPTALRGIQAKLEEKFDSFTLGKTKDSTFKVVKTSLNPKYIKEFLGRADEILELLADVSHLLPELRATFSPHDGPNRLTDHAIKTAALEAAAIGTFIDMDDLPPETRMGWTSACKPLSPARLHPIKLDNPPPPSTQKSFIHDHLLSMDPCLHPSHLWQHGQFLGHNMGPSPQRSLVPEFSFCSTPLHHDIRFPSPTNWAEDIYPRSDDPKWDDKIEERLLWRGSNTGIHHNPTSRWQGMHRNRFVQMVNDLVGTVNVLASNRTKDEPVGPTVEFKKARVNPAMMDVAYTSRPIMCSEPTCSTLEKMFEFRRHVGLKEAGRYKYVFDTDGNGWSSRFKRLITSNSLILKTTVYPEWFQDRIEPWVHYVPIQMDLSDLYDAFIFFRGDVAGEGAHDEMARKIAVDGRNWSKAFWRKEDMIAYLYRLLLEYARLMSLDRDEASFKLRLDDD